MLSGIRYISYVYAEAYDKYDQPIGKSRLWNTAAPVEAGPHEALEDTTADTSPEWLSKTGSGTTTVTVYQSQHASAMAEKPALSSTEDSWSVEALSSILPQLLTAFITGCFICGVLVGMIWAFRNYHIRRSASSKDVEYEPLNRHRDEEPDDEEIPLKD